MPQLPKISAQHYLTLRHKVDPEIRLLHSLADLLAQLEHAAPERVEIDPVSLGIVSAAMAQSALAVKGALDDFLPTNSAEALSEREKG